MKELFRKIIVWIVKHPWGTLFAVVFFIILLTFLPFGGSEEKPSRGKGQDLEKSTTTESTTNTPLVVPEDDAVDGSETMPEQDKSSPFDDDPKRKEAAARDLTSDPAVQFLPYRGALITANIVDRLNGKLIVHVNYMGDRSFAEREWREFLEAHKDDGSSYQVIYIEKK